MTKKNVLTAAVSLSLVACLSIGATLAYFTDTESKVNVFTTGKVNMTLTDESPEGEGLKTGTENDNGVEYVGVVPGDKLSKDVTITMADDSSDAYVAVAITVEGDDQGSPSNAELIERVEAAMDEVGFGNWTDRMALVDDEGNENGYVYILNWTAKAGEEIEIMDSVEIPAEWGNAYANSNFAINVTAYAAQAENLDKNEFMHMAYEQASGKATHFEEYTKG